MSQRHKRVERDDRPDVQPTIGEESQEAAELPSRRIGHFEILEVLGEGAFGAVYRANDPVLEREVAIKVPHASRIATSELRQRFLREARSAAGLRHPHICPVFEVGEEHETPYIVMAFINGQSLSAALKRRGHFSDRQAASLVRRLALALEFAHEQGIVHRDLKPDNIMIDRERKEPVIMDFGLARRASSNESELTQEGQLMGTPIYMPPEQARGDVAQIGPSSDVYSLGVILYELLCGRRPHEGSLAEVLSKVLTADADPPTAFRSDIDPALETICLKALARQTDDRYSSMAALADDLTAFLKSNGEHSEPVMPVVNSGADRAATEQTVLVGTATTELPAQDTRSGKSVFAGRRAGIGLVAVVVVVIGVVIAGPWFNRSDSEDTENRSGSPGSPQTTGDEESRPGNLIREFVANSQKISGLSLSPDNQWIVASTRRATVLVWHRDDETARLEKTIAKTLSRGHRCSIDGQSIVVFNPATVMRLTIPDGEKTRVSATPKPGPTNATVGESGIVFVNRAKEDAIVISKLSIGKKAMTSSISNDGDYFAWSVCLPESQIFMGIQRAGGVHFWDCNGHFSARKGDVLSDDNLTAVTGHDTTPTCLAWSQNELVAATADMHGTVILWDVLNRRELRRLKPHPSTVHSLALSNDGQRLLTGCGAVARAATREGLRGDFAVRLWDVETAELLQTVGSHRDTVTGVSFGGDATEGVSCSLDNTVSLWNLSANR